MTTNKRRARRRPEEGSTEGGGACVVGGGGRRSKVEKRRREKVANATASIKNLNGDVVRDENEPAEVPSRGSFFLRLLECTREV